MHSIYETVAKKPILSSGYLIFAYVFVKNSVPKMHIKYIMDDTSLPRSVDDIKECVDKAWCTLFRRNLKAATVGWGNL